MNRILLKAIGALAVLGLAALLAGCNGLTSGNARSTQPLKSATVSKLSAMGSSPGAAMMIRIYKESSELEVWKQVGNGSFKLFKSYEICAWSGALGPKIKEGDRQSPEGFYTITPGLMNPNSNYYLAFNTGFPNKFDRAHGRTGSDLMVHGDCSSRGCYSMTDESIAEIYALARETFKGGNNSFQLQIFPFRMTAKNFARHADSPHMSFWRDIKEGYDRFEVARRPPTWDVCEKQYVFGVSGGGLDAAASCPSGAKVLPASVAARQQADDAAFKTELAAINDRAAKQAAEEQAAADAKESAKARGEAIGSFFGGLFGGENSAEADQQPQTTAPQSAPVPQPRLDRV
ncbi:L,D-transpeptidase family protein [Devosia sp.]|uniref:L,D-transpeptidase family protein n=1 Tax=Devosia sp. TaxID=1871048 RepID=UPI003A8E9C3E